MDIELHKQVEAAARRLKDVDHVLAFSCGADSVASLIRMEQWGMRPALLYLYFLPEIPMVNNYLRYVEDRLQRPVYRMPSMLCMQFLVNGALQLPSVGTQVFEYCEAEGVDIAATPRINDYALECFADNTHLAVGLRVSDGIFRARKLRQMGAVHPDRPEWYPVADCFQSDVVEIIRKAGWKLPVDYRLFGRSFESIRHWTAGPIRAHCPRTWAYIRSVYPMADMLCAQDALLPASHHLKARVTAFKHLAFQTEDCGE